MHRPFNQRVGGSTPPGLTNKIKYLQYEPRPQNQPAVTLRTQRQAPPGKRDFGGARGAADTPQSDEALAQHGARFLEEFARAGTRRAGGESTRRPSSC